MYDLLGVHGLGPTLLCVMMAGVFNADGRNCKFHVRWMIITKLSYFTMKL